MISIPQIYTHFGLTYNQSPHCFVLENIAELFIPDDDAQQTKILHILPYQQSLAIEQVENFIKASRNNQPSHHSAQIFASQNRQGALRFHILSPNERDETEAALQLLSFFIKYMS